MQQQRGLGKGLSALLGENIEVAQPVIVEALEAGRVIEVPLTAIVAGKYQPRKKFNADSLQELASSIKSQGILQPIVLRMLESGQYEIIAGERRYRASMLAEKKTIPAIIRSFTEQEALAFSLIENVQREDQTPLEEANGYQRLLAEFNFTQEQLASIVHKSRSHITNMLRLLQLPAEVQEMLEANQLSVGHARSLINKDNALGLAKQMVSGGLNVRAAEQLVKPKSAGVSPQANLPKPEGRDPELVLIEQQISAVLGLDVSILTSGNGGTINIFFNTINELDNIVQYLAQHQAEHDAVEA